jgi:hypothetical protein
LLVTRGEWPLSGRAPRGSRLSLWPMSSNAGSPVERAFRGSCELQRLLWVVIAVLGCRAEPEAQLSTRIESLKVAPAVSPGVRPDDAACAFVEREAQKLGASMPRQLDADTAVTRVSARGCDLTLEYQLITLAASDVAPAGMLATRQRVAGQLCSDQAARATLERGGTFTNVYHDQSRVHVGQFTVSRDDCRGSGPPEPEPSPERSM